MRETPPTAYIDALEESQAARSRNTVDNISQWIVSKREQCLSLGYGHLTNAAKILRKCRLVYLMSYLFTYRIGLLHNKFSFNSNKVILFCDSPE